VHIDPRYGPAHQLLGDLYVRLAGAESDEHATATELRRAVVHYEKALALVPSQVVNPFEVHLNASKLHYRLGDTRRALEHAEAALRLAPETEREAVHALISMLTARPVGAP
jgi:tetratricopeptide (TPR) repeat protein